MPTVLDLAAYFNRAVLSGRAKWSAKIRPESIPCGMTCQLDTIAPPPQGRECDEEKKVVFIDVVLEE